MAEIPPRGPALEGKTMFFSFDVDCGELVPGHRFIARGLADCGRIALDEELSAPGVSLEYELVPGVPPLGDGASPLDFIVHVEYEADVSLPRDPVDGGAIAPFQGGPSTHGSLGDWPLPPDPRILQFRIAGPHQRRPGGGYRRTAAKGVLEVDLGAPSARWIAPADQDP